jgi:hypothetical protein
MRALSVISLKIQAENRRRPDEVAIGSDDLWAAPARPLILHLRFLQIEGSAAVDGWKSWGVLTTGRVRGSVLSNAIDTYAELSTLSLEPAATSSDSGPTFPTEDDTARSVCNEFSPARHVRGNLAAVAIPPVTKRPSLRRMLISRHNGPARQSARAPTMATTVSPWEIDVNRMLRSLLNSPV